MKSINSPAPTSSRQPRRDRLVRDRIKDPYHLREKPAEPAVCPTCGVVWHQGRWQWMDAPAAGAKPVVCPACRRINDAQPAGVVSIDGWFVEAHKDEIIGLVRRCEQEERAAHPLNRIMALREDGHHLEITTTDIHLPRRIGDALASAYVGVLTYDYPEGEYFIRVHWRRDV